MDESYRAMFESYRSILKVIARCLKVIAMVKCHRAMLKHIARHFKNDNENYHVIACNLSSDVNTVSRDIILHCSMLIKNRAMTF